MAGPRRSFAVIAERLRSTLWPIPGLAAVVSAVAAIAMSAYRPETGSLWWPGEAESGRALLEVLAGSSLTVVALVFSLQVVSLQLAASQYSPRLLRTYARDAVTQASLAVLIATFVFSLVSLALFGAVDRPPRMNVAVAAALGLAGVAALLGVVAHIVTSLRVETMMARLHADALGVINREVAEAPRSDVPPALRPDGQTAPLVAPRSGFVQAVDREGLASIAHDREVVLVLDVTPGDQVLAGTAIGSVRGAHDAGSVAVDAARRILIGYERTPDEDPRFGLLQLVDIGVRALSPGINDPTTAVHAIGHLADLMMLMGRAGAGGLRRTDDKDGVGRVWEPRPGLSDYLDAVCPPLIRAGAEHPQVLLAIAELLSVVAESAATGAADTIRPQIQRLQNAAERGIADPDEKAAVQEALDTIDL